jgi:hypothetical protein
VPRSTGSGSARRRHPRVPQPARFRRRRLAAPARPSRRCPDRNLRGGVDDPGRPQTSRVLPGTARGGGLGLLHPAQPNTRPPRYRPARNHRGQPSGLQTNRHRLVDRPLPHRHSRPRCGLQRVLRVLHVLHVLHGRPVRPVRPVRPAPGTGPDLRHLHQHHRISTARAGSVILQQTLEPNDWKGTGLIVTSSVVVSVRGFASSRKRESAVAQGIADERPRPTPHPHQVWRHTTLMSRFPADPGRRHYYSRL